MMRRGGWLLAVVVAIATLGGFWSVTGMITQGIEAQVKERTADLEKLRESMLTSLVDLRANAKAAVQEIEVNAKATTEKMANNAKAALQEIETEKKRVSEEGQRASIEIRGRVSSLTVAAEPKADVITIPVVVHVVYQTETENISEAQITSQIESLNKDFRAKNEDLSKVPAPFKELIGDAGIEFVLATEDPEGKPTKGITRTKTTRKSFASDDAVKSALLGGVDAWPAETYLNIWVCTLQGGLLRYSQFPGGPKKTDGVVVFNVVFGTTGTAKAPFDKGRSLTGGIGLYLNLRHIWGDKNDGTGTDLVADTPPQLGPNFGKPTFPHISMNNAPDGDLFMNFMDYVDDDAMYMFTKGQVERMRQTLQVARNRLGKR